jgi:hypothetical protein
VGKFDDGLAGESHEARRSPSINAIAIFLVPRACHALPMAYLGNLTCRDCGLTFTSRWGSVVHADEYRCDNDHVLQVEPSSGTILTIDGTYLGSITLPEVRGRCPLCSTELATGLLPSCPVCGGRDHDVLLEGMAG